MFFQQSFLHICLFVFIRWIEINSIYDELFLIIIINAYSFIPRISINILFQIYSFSKFWLVPTRILHSMIDTYIMRLFDERWWIGRRTTNIWHFSEYQMRRIYLSLSLPPRNIVSFNIFSSYLAFLPIKVWPKVCNHFSDYT